MDIKETLNEGLVREYQLILTAKELEQKIATRLKEMAETVSMPGFRPGKVPASLIKTRYGEQVKGEIIKTELDESAKQTVEEHKLQMASQPHLDIVSFEDNEDLVAKLRVEVMPAITIPDLSAIKVERPMLAADEEAAQNMLVRLADQNRPTVKIDTKRKSKSGDVLLIDYIGRVDGDAFEGGTATDHMLELGSNSFIPGFEEGLIGVQAGEKIDLKINFPDEYQEKSLAGKKSVFECSVKEIHEKSEASIDAALASKLGFDTLDGLRGAVAKSLESHHSQALRQKLKTNVFDCLADKVEFVLPKSLLDTEYKSVVEVMKKENNIEDSHKHEDGHDHDHEHDHDHDHAHEHAHEHAVDEGLDEAQKKEALSLASRRVRLGLLLTEIGNVNNIEVSEADIRNAVMEQAKRYPGQEQKIIDFYSKNQEAVQNLAGPIFEDRVIDYIIEMAEVTDKEITSVELYDKSEEEQKPKKQGATGKIAAKKSAKNSDEKSGEKSGENSDHVEKASAKKAASPKSAKKPAAKTKES